MKYVSTSFFFGSYLAAILLTYPFTIGPLIGGEGTIEPEHVPFVVIGSAFSLYAVIVFFVLLYKMWKIVPLELARTTPGKAVGFLFIPIFNFYWVFPAIWGWTKDFNNFLRQRQIDSQHVSESMGLAIAVFWVIGGLVGTISGFAGVPAIGWIVGFPNLILIPVFIYKVCTVLNNLPDEIKEAALRPGAQSQELSGPRSFGIASLVLGIISILIPYLGLVLGIIGIVLARKQRRVRREGLSLAGLITSIIGTILWGISTIILVIALAVA